MICCSNDETFAGNVIHVSKSVGFANIVQLIQRKLKAVVLQFFEIVFNGCRIDNADILDGNVIFDNLSALLFEVILEIRVGQIEQIHGLFESDIDTVSVDILEKRVEHRI